MSSVAASIRTRRRHVRHPLRQASAGISAPSLPRAAPCPRWGRVSVCGPHGNGRDQYRRTPREADMSVLDLTQDDNVTTRVGDKLKGRVAFVTGGTRGIGAAICRSLASQGAVLAAGYAGNDKAAGEFRDAFTGTYATAVSIHKGNVGEPGDCRRTIDEVIKTHGRLDILVNNAGITSDKTVLKMADDDWFKVLNVNLSGAFFLSQAALRHMAERGSGRIVNVSSVIGEMG